MTSRRSSGSIRAESAVEPTRSQNITVTWRRSPVASGLRCDRRSGDRERRHWGNGRRCGCRPVEFGDLTQQLASMTERHPNVFEVLIREIGEDGNADVVLGKALCVLSETELLQPVSDLLHSGQRPLLPGFIRPGWTTLSEKPAI